MIYYAQNTIQNCEWDWIYYMAKLKTRECVFPLPTTLGNSDTGHVQKKHGSVQDDFTRMNAVCN